LDRAEQIDERTAKAIDRPGHHNVELAPARVRQHGIEARPAVSALGAADAGVFPVYDHPIREVPANYGDEVRFYRLPEADAGLIWFLEYARDRGVPNGLTRL
jgi:hypothetical protein